MAFSGFQSNSFQGTGYQIVRQPIGNSGGWSYHVPYQKRKKQLLDEIDKAQKDIQEAEEQRVALEAARRNAEFADRVQSLQEQEALIERRLAALERTLIALIKERIELEEEEAMSVLLMCGL